MRIIPRIGLGVWQIPDGEIVRNAVRWALEAGYRHIDTAMIYRNEKGVGEGIKAGNVPREEMFVTTKLWISDQGYDSALKAIRASLERLQLDYVDLYLVHWPFADEEKTQEKRADTWRGMEEIQRLGLARLIGVSNYTETHLEEMRSYAKVMPTVNQVEMHPFLYQKALAEYFATNGIQIEAYSPLAHGEKLNDKTVSKIAKKYGKSNAQILTRWALEHGFVVLPKSTHKERIEENFDVLDSKLETEDMKTLDNLNENFRTCWDPY
ncbi:MAG: glyoxal reductase [Candidatus Doudnabacteria bacterium RIFCSPHIGHO2_01_FULL_49_9]|uniref:Glyoxal reductase n=1 Tax=Candidatus Doudnabacteria bacterium RIFCSPHIGHO2_01_FULL_49_9 TaxID=1817827 RepID=A0A1F5NYE6_9BACT|nr:MAG: glyoxal reductase [Candidatus Doudnabacteria bacterium RIFCSPHIGHO2_01_FULL_49_9]